MFFKKIEMSGFKSFAAKTDVEFLPGVTIVVGPNGCGKSNIFDAIRWALGEQSPKSLRGQKMGDVIFNGCATQKPHSFAQVNLIINNEDRKVPIDFNEIVVSRRLFRTGESEYFINKTACRLRDIYDLFMDTGVGTDSYSVMQQHQVDQIITSKPRERSYIFEEAAGISKYKARKEETLRKLLKTEEDLLRINDLLIEIQRNVNSLKRAASRAEKYKSLHAEQIGIQMRHLYLQHKSVETQLSSVKKELQSTIDKLTELGAKISLLESQNEEAKLESEKINKQISESVSKEHTVSSEIEKKEHNVNILVERIKNLDEQKNKINDEINSGKDLIKTIEQKIQLIESEFSDINKQYEEAGKLSLEKQEIYNKLKSEYESKLTTLDEKRAEINRKISIKIQIENDKRLAQTMVEKLSQELSDEQSSLANLKSEVETLLQKRNDAQAKISEINQSLKEKQKEFDDNRKRLGNLEKDEISVSKNIENVISQIQKTQTKLASLEELQLNYEGYYAGAKEVMRAGDKKKLKGIIGVVAKLINLKKEHEAAIEAALGGDIQDIVTETVEDAKAAVEYLRKNDYGYATFIPLDFIDPPKLNTHDMKTILNFQGVIGLARELIQYDKSIQKAIEYLFGDTIVVEDIDVAINLGKAGHRIRCVSLKGDLLNPRGVLKGGSHKSKGLLTRERELIEARKELTEIQKQESSLKEKWNNIKKDIKSIYLQNEIIVKNIHEKEINLASEKRSFENLNETFNARNKQLAQSNSHTDLKIQEVNKYKTLIEENTKQLANFEIEDFGLDFQIKEAESALSNDRNNVQAALDEVNKININISALKERKASYEEKIISLKEDITRYLSEEKKRYEEISQKDTEKKKLEKEIQSVRVELAKLIEERETLKTELSSTAQQQEFITNKLKSVSEKLQVLYREQNDYTNRKHELEVTIAQFQTQNDNFANQAMENFNTPLEDVLKTAEEILQKDMESITDESEKSKLTDREYLRNRIYEIRDQIDRLGPVNPSAIDEYNEEKQRLDFNLAQQKDLVEAKESLKKTITQIDETTTRMFNETFESIRKNFIEMFRKLFGGGKADLILVQEENQPELGVEIIAQPPGKKLQNISLLSGGEKALTAIALLFGIFLHKPSPFCILDEIDAPLDDANVIRFTDLLKEFSLSTQFIVITHNKQTMSLADTIYGITMEEPGVSKLVSVKFEDIESSQMVVGK